ncbi:DUF3108 domain-containing protein [Variovorax sp. RHLX14]|uniref:DUF3108 domain-containing protein n=1 Tax=Variovorax sp. RHLX14 TaxID=1259731 RepID=UPI003F470CD8
MSTIFPNLSLRVSLVALCAAACLALGMPFAPARAAEPVVADAPPPVYPTRIARSFSLLYQMQRGGISGSGEFSWKRNGDSYESHLKGSIAGFTVLNWASSGGFDASGVAPARYLESRIGKSDREAVFRRDASVVDFSGVSPDIPLLPGTQDRLSWMVQLPAILSADPTRAKLGARVGMYVVGVRGHGETWTFESAGPESIKTPSGTIRAVKLIRELHKPEDTQAEVWVDPSRQYLPVRIRLATPPFDAPLELNLAGASS